MDAMDKLNTIDDKLNMLLTGHNNENRDSVCVNFKCLICLEIQCSTLFFCVYGCGRFVGCFICCYRLSKCPNCRKNLPGKGIRKPMIVPGLAKSLKLPEQSNHFWRQTIASTGFQYPLAIAATKTSKRHALFPFRQERLVMAGSSVHCAVHGEDTHRYRVHTGMER